MRPRREAKPPRRPRVLTWRLVVVSLVVGVVLAVGSVPASIFIRQTPWIEAQRREQEFAVQFGDRVITVRERRDPMGTLRSWHMTPAWITVQQLEVHGSTGTTVVDADPRPPRVGAWLDANGGVLSEYRAGWPLRAARHQVRVAIPNQHSLHPRSVVAEIGIVTISAFGRDWPIPTLPLWPGLLGNTLFYTLLVLTPIALLRWRTLRRRARRGLCLACAYELGEGVSACPECGLARRGS